MSIPLFIQGVGLSRDGDDFPAFIRRHLPEEDLAASLASAPDIKSLLPGVNLRRVSPVGRLALAAAGQALNAGGLALPLDGKTSPSTGLFIGSGLGAVQSILAFMDSVLDDGPGLASPTHFSHSINNVFCGLLSLNLNIQGPSCTVSQFGLSFAGAWQAALSSLAAGEISWALVGAVEESVEKLNKIYQEADQDNESALTGPPTDSNTAVFFLLSREPGARPLCSAALAWHTFRQGMASPPLKEAWPQGVFPGRPYAGQPADQALDLALATALASHGRLPMDGIACRRKEPRWGLGVELLLQPVATGNGGLERENGHS